MLSCEDVAMDVTQRERIGSGQGFFAALDQSGGSTPKALAEYGVAEDRYGSEAEMFDLVHAMRTRVISDPAFEGVPTGRYLWERKRVVPILKVDKGLADEERGVQLMKPIDTLDDLLSRARAHRMFGTKMRSVVKDADRQGVRAIVDQQFEYADRIRAVGLVPILEPEVDINAPRKAEAEALLHDAIAAHIDLLPVDATIMLKLTIPSEPGRYADLAADPRVLQVVALSGGYSRDEACARLAKEPAMIASFSRALLEGLTDEQSDEQFSATLDASIGQIYNASVNKTASV
jgi:fructose-bisphosphate aldolase class I